MEPLSCQEFKSVEKNITFAVMFYIHGGSNRAGMGAMLPGDILAAYGQIIVINFNYRLGLLGFLSSPENNFTGNNGLLDQVTAMKWIHSNIHYFDGDESRVTIVGHSAGAGDVGLHLVSPLTKGLFSNAVLMSGSPLAHWAMAMPNLYKGSNINSTILRYALTAADIRSVDMVDLKAIEIILSTLLPFSVVPFPAVVDNYYLTKHPRSSFQNGEFRGNAFLLSFTADESFGDIDLENYPFPGHLMRYKPFYPTICNFEDTLRKVYGDIELTGRRLVEAEADMLFYASIIELADLIADSGVQRNVSVFEYDILLSDPIKSKYEGVEHGQDIFYMFGVPLVGSKHTTYTQADIEVSKAEMALYSNFVKSGSLSLDGLTRLGSLYNNRHRSYSKMSFSGGNITIEQFRNFRESKLEFWNNIVLKTNVTCDAISSKSSTIVLIHMFYYTCIFTLLFCYHVVCYQ
ncbi:neuroligin-4, Y-linked-like isoform X2 [Ostrea edulis]|uniref:neuroligin-4, Y-linked-like isoform X2 n=1 Tax=Ostrea edulis TaxID=37623 RepID=UPI0020942AED|nr:neuroligin-4, Y-linked-like isoform X2 [Ostrea edulis]